MTQIDLHTASFVSICLTSCNWHVQAMHKRIGLDLLDAMCSGCICCHNFAPTFAKSCQAQVQLTLMLSLIPSCASSLGLDADLSVNRSLKLFLQLLASCAGSSKHQV